MFVYYVVNTFACLNCLYYINVWDILKPHKFLFISKYFFNKHFWCLYGIAVLLYVWEAGLCNKSY